MRWALCLFAIALLQWPARARAGALECIAAHADGQVLHKSGKLQAARQRFATCANDACPALIRKDCASFEVELEAAQPSLAVIAKSAAGGELRIAAINVDDGLAPTPSPMLLDPGQHRVSVWLPDGRHETATVFLREAEKFSLSVPFKDLPSEADRPSLVPTASYVLGAVGVAGLASFSYFGLRGRAKENSFDQCSKTHTCPVPEVQEMRHLYLAADISLCVSLVSLGLGTYFFVKRADDQARPGPAQQSQAVRFNVVAAPGAYLLSATGRF